MFHRQGRRHDGITLIEMMIVLAVAAILAAVGVPQLYEYVVRNRIEAAANEFVTALNLARSEAIRRGETITVRQKPGGVKAVDWSEGWWIYADVNGDGLLNNGDEVIRETSRFDKPMTLFSARNSSPAIFFAADGQTISSGGIKGADAVYVFVFCYEGKIIKKDLGGTIWPRSWAVTANKLGRIRLTTPDRNTGELWREKVDGEIQVMDAHCLSPG
jgi:type IV fimbrial biogenesis protein FimT